MSFSNAGFTGNLKTIARPLAVAVRNLRLPKNKPIVLQIPITHACDSRCNMCGIGASQNDARDINPEELGKILADPLFSEVESIGFNGGEPTLRDDLIPLLEQCLRNLPKLARVNLITNGIQRERIFRIVSGIDAFLKSRGKSFNLSVSLDGIGRLHDLNRGVDGNFESAVGLMEDLLKAGVYVWAGATLTPVTVYSADDLVELFEKLGLPYYEFRLAVPIKRLAVPTKAMPRYNLLSYLKFNPDQLFHVTQFFHRMAETGYGKGDRATYRSIWRHLAFGEPRSAGCLWKSNGLTLDAAGDLSWCSVESDIIGSALTTPPGRLWREGQPERERILRDKCATCMHDLSGPIAFGQAVREVGEVVSRKAGALGLKLDIRKSRRSPSPLRSGPAIPLREIRKAIITGWWGTETHGDKAIVGELVHFLNLHCPNLESIVFTSFPGFEYVVEKTVAELRETGACDLSRYQGTIPISGFANSKAFAECQGVFIGGGPMEEISELAYIEKAFAEAARSGRQAIVFGCGIDPHLGGLEAIVTNLLRSASGGFFRDAESHAAAERLCGKDIAAKFGYACDPAIRFVMRWRDLHHAHAVQRDGLALLLRENTPEYVHGNAASGLSERNRDFASAASAFLDGESALTVKFLAMNCHWIGKDDRLLNRKILAGSREPASGRFKSFGHKYMTLHALLKNLASSEYAFAMRYHGHLLAFALGIPFLSIDYTGKDNKVGNFLRRTGLERYTVRWEESLGAGEFAEVFGRVRAAAEEVRSNMALKRVELGQALEAVYLRLEATT
jgi:polysaccharide pyruvyl transferase WcaK-like protein/sulfatase maturation enzyme AslB (radical SAM superfamily)